MKLIIHCSFKHCFFFCSPGSILVDYFVELNEVKKKINTLELKSIFHDALRLYSNRSFEGSDNSTRLGSYVIDPKYTDFVGELRKKNNIRIAEEKNNSFDVRQFI